jgi:hypothetical protein
MKRRRFALAIVRICAGLFLSAALATAGNAGARDAPVSDHARRARVAYDLRDWPIAVAEYRAAYEAEPRSEYLFGLAQALRQSHDYGAAIFTFKAYKRSEAVTVQQATAAELLISQCEAEQTKAEAEAARDSARAASPREASATRSDVPSTASALLPQSASAQGSVLGAAPPPATSQGEGGPFYADVLGDGLFIVGLGAAGVGTALLLHGNATMSKSDDAPTEGAAAGRRDDAKHEQAAAMVLCPVGGVLIVAAIWRWLSVGSEAPQMEGLSLGPGSISVYGRF